MNLKCLSLIADCIRPALYELYQSLHGRQSFVFDTVYQLESSHPQAVANMLAHADVMFTVGPDAICRNKSGKVYHTPRLASAQLTECFPNQVRGAPSAAGMAIGSADHCFCLSEPVCAVKDPQCAVTCIALHVDFQQSRECCCGSLGDAGGHPRDHPRRPQRGAPPIIGGTVHNHANVPSCARVTPAFVHWMGVQQIHSLGGLGWVGGFGAL